MDHRGIIRGGAYLESLNLERDWLDAYPGDVPFSLSYPDAPVSSLLENAAARFPVRSACTIFDHGLTYRQLAGQARHLADGLTRLGAAPGRRIGLVLPNSMEYLVALQAIWLTGATALQLSPLMPPEELVKWLRMTDCHMAIALDLLAPNLEPAQSEGLLEHIIVTSLAGHLPSWRGWIYCLERLRRHGPLRLRDTPGVHCFDHLVRSNGRAARPRIDPVEDVAVLAPTGGTTASPKVVMLTHRNLVANAYQLRAWSRGRDGQESTLGVLPFFHSYGLSVCVLTSWACGSTIHLHPRFDPAAVLDIIERHRVDTVPAVPAIIAAFNRELDKHPRRLSFIRGVISGASALDPAVREKFLSFGARQIVEGYGLTEASPVTHVTPMDGRDMSGSIGLPLPDTDACIRDQDDGVTPMPIGSVGELVVRGPQVMKGYFANKQETARVLRDGWLYTGDLARRDRSGYFTLVDRKKDIIKTSGFLVFPAEVEEVLCRFPGVAEAGVIGVPNAECGELVKAIVVPRKDGRLSVKDLERHCEVHLGKQKRPRQFEIVESLPKNFLGKVQRRRLRERMG